MQFFIFFFTFVENCLCFIILLLMIAAASAFVISNGLTTIKLWDYHKIYLKVSNNVKQSKNRFFIHTAVETARKEYNEDKK